MNKWQKQACGLGSGFLLGTTLLATQGLAADLPVAAYVAPAPVEDPSEPFDWDRFYGGVFVGYGWSNVDVTTDAPFPGFENNFFTRTLDLQGPFAGITLGKNFAFRNEDDDDTDFVLGIEGDIALANIYTEFTAADAFPFIGDGNAFMTVRLDTLATIRARIGLPLGDNDTFMPYVTGGLAAGHLDIYIQPDGNGPPPTPAISASEWLFGYTIGGGVEAAVSENVTIKAEYLYTDLVGDISLSSVNPNPLAPQSATFNLGGIHTIKVGLNVHF